MHLYFTPHLPHADLSPADTRASIFIPPQQALLRDSIYGELYVCSNADEMALLLLAGASLPF